MPAFTSGNLLRRAGSRLVASAALALAAVTTAQAGLLYAIREIDNHLIRIDTSTLARTDIGATGVGGNFGGLAYKASTDTLYWIPGRGVNDLYTINRATGAATLVGSHGIGDLFGLEYDPTTDTLYATQLSTGSGLYRLNQSTGAATVINPAMTHGIGGLAYDSLRDQLVGIEDGAGDLHAIDRATGAQTLLFAGDFTNDSGLAYDSDTDKLWDIDWSGFLYRYDPAAGYARTTMLSGLGAHDGLAYVSGDQTPVPEPGGLALIALALAGVALARGRRRA